MLNQSRLSQRWLTSQGREYLKQVASKIQAYGNTKEIKLLIQGLEHVADVEPLLDFRAMPMESIKLFRLDLSGTDMSGIKLSNDIVECMMTGCIFNKIKAENQCFSGDFYQTSFVEAELTGSRFKAVRLSDTNFSQAKMVRAGLRQQNLRQSIFRNTNLYMAELTGADIRGADFSGADCTEATFGEVLFDDNTQFKNCILTAGYLSAALEEYAYKQGAIINKLPQQRGKAEISAAIKILDTDELNENHAPLVKRLRRILNRASDDIQWDWLAYVTEQLPEEQVKVLKKAVEETCRD